MSCSSGGKDLTIEVWERIGEGVAALVGARRDGRVHRDIVTNKELLQHLPGSDQEIAVAPLASELERTLHRRLRRATRAGRSRTDVRSNDYLELALDLVNESSELWSSDDSGKLLVGRHSHLGLEWDMVLVHVSSR